jgi:hypothetical protein
VVGWLFLQVIDTHTLQATEMPTAITSCSFADDTNVYYCVRAHPVAAGMLSRPRLHGPPPSTMCM